MSYGLFTAESGSLVSIQKKSNNDFRLIQMNYPTISNTIEFNIKINNSANFFIVSTVPDGIYRDPSYPNPYNPTITIWDTDIIKFNHILNTYTPDLSNVILTIAANNSDPLEEITQHTVLNNNCSPDETLRWYPGINNTGTFYYLNNPISIFDVGGVINVIHNPNL